MDEYWKSKLTLLRVSCGDSSKGLAVIGQAFSICKVFFLKSELFCGLSARVLVCFARYGYLCCVYIKKVALSRKAEGATPKPRR